MRTLYHLPLSPFSRKVRLVLAEKRLPFDLRLEKVWERRPEYLELNPAGTVPTLVEDNSVAIPDSGVICEYLDSVGDTLPMFPSHGALRWRALKFQAMGDGILDASVPRRGEMQKPQDEGRVAWIALQKAAVDRTLDAL